MVIYLPVKFEFDWTQHFRVRVRKQKCWRTVKQTKKGTNERTELHQFRKEPSYDGDLCPCQVRIRLDTPFSSYSPETKMWTDRWMDRQTDKKRTNDGRNYTNFERNLAMIVFYLPVKFEFDWSNYFRVRVQKRKMWMDRQTAGWLHATRLKTRWITYRRTPLIRPPCNRISGLSDFKACPPTFYTLRNRIRWAIYRDVIKFYKSRHQKCLQTQHTSFGYLTFDLLLFIQWKDTD